MGNFRDNRNSGGRGFDRGSSGGGRFGGGSRGGFGGGRGRSFGGDRERPQMHDATCAKCGKACQIPFRPRGDKPVLCSDCFRDKENGGSSQRSNDRPMQQSQSAVSSEQFKRLESKIDKIIEILGELEIVSDEDELDAPVGDEDEEVSDDEVLVESEEDLDEEDEDEMEDESETESPKK